MLTSRSQMTERVKTNSHDIINQITRIDSGFGTFYNSHYIIGYSIPAIVKWTSSAELIYYRTSGEQGNNIHELTRALYVKATRRLCYDELNAMPLGWRCDENQINSFSIDLFSSAASFTVARSTLWCRIV